MILEKVGKDRYPSFEMIKDHLFDHGFEVSSRTIQRDLEQIRFEFGIEIMYDRNRNGYHIDPETSINTESFLRFLEIVNTAELLTESLKESKDSLDFISFESHGALMGIEHLKPLLYAIKNQRKVGFVHENFDKETKRDYIVHPYLLKEYQNRWYLIAIIENTDQFRVFGIDRIQTLELLEAVFKPDIKINPMALFENIIGLNYSDDEPEEVILSLTPLQAKYVKSLPLHGSQETIMENENEVHIRLRIVPNYEFKQKILMLGENIKVLKPQRLVDDILRTLTATIKNYGQKNTPSSFGVVKK